MSYGYYCVDCGEYYKGNSNKISFDLGELTGLRDMLTKEKKGKLEGYNISLGQVSIGRFLETYKGNGVKVDDDGDGSERYGEAYTIEYTLKTYLYTMALNYGNGYRNGYRPNEYTDRVLKLTLNDLYNRPDENILCEFLGLNVTGANTQMEINFFVNQLTTIFQKNSRVHDEQDLNKYVCRFEVRTVLFDDGSGTIETLEYRNNVNKTWTKISYNGRIRGYCPNCGSPIIDGCGRCEHILVGLLGAQSAGKTSTIIALMEYMKNHSDLFGIRHPSSIPSRDKKYNEAFDNMRLYENGWAVKKTNIDDKTTFNASLLLKSNRYKEVERLVTFIDIAGEVLYDAEEGGLNTEQMKSYPLIDKCDLYIVCSCTNSKDNTIPQDAIITIASQIYDRLAQKKPMCIALTKIDQLGEVDSGAEALEDENIFEKIHPVGSYAYAQHLNTLKQGYAQNLDDSVRDALVWCHKTFDTFRNETLVTMINTAAYGYQSTRYEGKTLTSIQISQEGRPRPKGIDDLWRWVLTMSGLIPTSQGYIFKKIPQKNKMDSSAKPQFYLALQSQFMNPPRMPVAQDDPEQDDDGDGGFWDKFSRLFRRRR